MNWRHLIVALSTVLVAAAIALLAVSYFPDRKLSAQTPGPKPAVSSPQTPHAMPERPVGQASPPTAAPVGQASPPTAAPVRTETITYDAWTVTCRGTADDKGKMACSATLPMVVQQQDQRLVDVGAWIITHNTDGALLSVLQTPQINVGVLIAKGVQLKLGEGKPHMMNYVACNPQRCEATMPMDDAVIRELLASANGPAAVTFWKTDGAEFTINIQSIKGVDKAVVAVR